MGGGGFTPIIYIYYSISFEGEYEEVVPVYLICVVAGQFVG